MNECPECGSEKIVKNVFLKDLGENNAEFALRAAFYEKPDAWIFKQPVHSDVRAEVCGDCGFLQTYAADPKRLWFAYLAANSGVE